MSDHEQDEVVHEYDDIQEYDNQLPNWWLFALFGTIAFACVYWFGYQKFEAADLPNAEFEKVVAAQRAIEAERIKSAGVIDDDALTLLSKDAATVGKGQEIFKANCVICHRADGGGNIGPNLTDTSWLHGSKPTNLYTTVNEGVSAKGMPAWGGQLGVDKTQSVVAYVMTLKNTNAPSGKPPQGVVEP
jgi:cytochrome c oxidase cbb3-type subunit III